MEDYMMESLGLNCRDWTSSREYG